MRITEEDIDELIEEIRRRDQFYEEFDIYSNETITYTNKVEETDGSLLTLGPTSQLLEFLYSNARYTKGCVLLFLA